MAKNYKKRGYPGKELKKQKQRKVSIIYNDPYPSLIGAEKHANDCEITALRYQVARLKNEVMTLTWGIQHNRETWNKNKKENITLSKKISRLKHHLDSLTHKQETIMKNTKLSRLIKILVVDGV